MSGYWKRWMVSGGAVFALACSDTGGGGTADSDDGSAATSRDGSVDAARGDASMRDGSVRRDGSAVTAGDSGSSGDSCGVLMARIRDFTPDTNPDFEKFSGSEATTGILDDTLDSDHLPVFKAANGQVTSKASFDQWYRDEQGVNIDIPISIPNQASDPSNEYSYSSSAFFPIDDMGFGNYLSSGHNFHFTTQIAASFTYKGGEVFDFTGDDDLWIFVNDKLALDLGGLHQAVNGKIDFDAQATKLGLTKGQTYRMDIFHAERHTNESNFKFSTTISCFMPTFI